MKKNKQNVYKYPPIVFGGQYGGEDADSAVYPILKTLGSLSKEVAQKHYGIKIQSLSFMFRVDGSVVQYGFEGTQFPKIDTKEKYATIDLGVPLEKWRGQEAGAIRQYVGEIIRQGHLELLNMLKNEGYDFEYTRASDDIILLVNKFIS